MEAKAPAIKNPPAIPDLLLQDLRSLIVQARQDVARMVNSSLVLLYWNVGRRIRQDILKEKTCRLWGGNCVDTVETIGN